VWCVLSGLEVPQIIRFAKQLLCWTVGSVRLDPAQGLSGVAPLVYSGCSKLWRRSSFLEQSKPWDWTPGPSQWPECWEQVQPASPVVELCGTLSGTVCCGPAWALNHPKQPTLAWRLFCSLWGFVVSRKKQRVTTALSCLAMTPSKVFASWCFGAGLCDLDWQVVNNIFRESSGTVPSQTSRQWGAPPLPSLVLPCESAPGSWGGFLVWRS
jgi:hypothetical protein